MFSYRAFDYESAAASILAPHLLLIRHVLAEISMLHIHKWYGSVVSGSSSLRIPFQCILSTMVLYCFFPFYWSFDSLRNTFYWTRDVVKLFLLKLLISIIFSCCQGLERNKNIFPLKAYISTKNHRIGTLEIIVSMFHILPNTVSISLNLFLPFQILPAHMQVQNIYEILTGISYSSRSYVFKLFNY